MMASLGLPGSTLGATRLRLADLAQSSWAYLIVPGVILVDAFVGVLPAETVLHAAGVGAAQGDISVIVVIVEAGVAAVVADFALYTIGTMAATASATSSSAGRSRGSAMRPSARSCTSAPGC